MQSLCTRETCNIAYKRACARIVPIHVLYTYSVYTTTRMDANPVDSSSRWQTAICVSRPAGQLFKAARTRADNGFTTTTTTRTTCAHNYYYYYYYCNFIVVTALVRAEITAARCTRRIRRLSNQRYSNVLTYTISIAGWLKFSRPSRQ